MSQYAPIPRRRYVWSLGAVLIIAAVGVNYARWQASGYMLDATALGWATLVGMLAQFVDGALGMAYGVTAASFFLAIGFTPAVASASVHVAKLFTSGASALSHWRMGNIERSLLWRLVIPGIVGALIGVYVLTSADGTWLKPYVNGYLLFMGIWIIIKAFWQSTSVATGKPATISLVGFVGAFVDAIGGGGWGPVVTTSMLGTGREARYVVGTVNSAEFFVTLVSGVTLALIVSVQAWESVAGLILGGMVMAPFAAWVAGRLPRKLLMVAVGVLISCLSAWSLWQYIR
jgi:uncharacterized membrane protein YfcA